MTIREQLNKKKRIFAISSYIALALLVISGLLLVAQYIMFLPVVIILFIIFFTATGLTFLGIRCNNCKGNIGIITQYSGLFTIPKKFHYCPYCGISLDEEVEAIKVRPSS